MLFTTDEFEETLYEVPLETYDDGSDVGAWTNKNDATTVICNVYDPLFPDGTPKTGAALRARERELMAFNPGMHNTCASNDPLSSSTTYATNSTNPGQFDTDAITLNMSYELSDNSRIVYTGGYRDEEDDLYLLGI